MRLRYPFEKKSYAMRRMAKAIERAISEEAPERKERAARWAAAWGLHCGIAAKPVQYQETYDIEFVALQPAPAAPAEAGPSPEPAPAPEPAPVPEPDDGPIAALLALPEQLSEQLFGLVDPDAPAPA
ncbi:hypothetical protein [Massilia glaciei]|uniref:hypothetical protein n=1 Tax=Massilia glaciei TaxID=1524097 RepID=UPI001C639E5D|nr:hypothetical protein [Massilia glaciei]